MPLYKFFDNNYYFILDVTKNSDNEEQLVIQLYNKNRQCWYSCLSKPDSLGRFVNDTNDGSYEIIVPQYTLREVQQIICNCIDKLPGFFMNINGYFYSKELPITFYVTDMIKTHTFNIIPKFKETTELDNVNIVLMQTKEDLMKIEKNCEVIKEELSKVREENVVIITKLEKTVESMLANHLEKQDKILADHTKHLTNLIEQLRQELDNPEPKNMFGNSFGMGYRGHMNMKPPGF